MKRIVSALFVLSATAATVLLAQTFTTLRRFHGADGANANAQLLQSTDGELYGTTLQGGAAGKGTVFKITPSGKLTPLYSFCTQSGCTDGGCPAGALIQATNGDFYGTTSDGGANGGGTVFKITPIGELTTLYNFCSQSACADGRSPQGALVQATNWDLYGTTAGYDGSGATVFKITPASALTTLYTFCSQGGTCPDGQSPVGALIQATDGTLYGTASDGGANGYGTVYQITPSGALTTLHSFDMTDGSGPGSLVQATDGNFYGATVSGGVYDDGTVFKITPNGTLTTVYSFGSEIADGFYPFGGLIQATDGNFYGTARSGGTIHERGTVYELTPSGALTTIIHFLLQSPVRRRQAPVRRSGAVYQWEFLRDDLERRERGWLWHDLQPLRRTRPLRENTDYLRQSGSGRQDFGDRSDRHDQRHI
jgi:uncharacterized repeat protein (TIGR03803 family)